MSLFPESALPEKGSETRVAMEADIEPGMIKDRRQEIVIIGSDLNKEAITKALDACLLRKEEIGDFPIPGKENKGIEMEDFKKNGWKFGWKPKSDDEDCLPPWPNVKEALEAVVGNEDEDDCEEDKCSKENIKTSTIPSRKRKSNLNGEAEDEICVDKSRKETEKPHPLSTMQKIAE